MGDVVVLTTRARVAKWATGIVARRGPFGTRFDLAPIVIHITAAMIESLLDPAEPVSRSSRPGHWATAMSPLPIV